MARAKKKHPQPDRVAIASAAPTRNLIRIPAGMAGAGALILCALVFYWTPLTSGEASIQWDAVDVHYSSQKYFADHVREFRLPHWTPYIFSGFPFLADPQVGAWYPLNWPFFLVGITPRAIQAEITLHALIAALGAWALVRVRMRGEHAAAALLAGIAYGFGGFFAAHSSHVGMVQTAAWLPWLLLAITQSLRVPGLGWPAAGGLIAGLMFLAGHFQTFLYSGLAAAAVLVFDAVVQRPTARRVVTATVVALAISALTGAVMYLPGLELLRLSIRSEANYSGSTNAPLAVSDLATLVFPNALGAVSGQYHGPEDITQHYFYAGLLTIGLAIWGLVKGRRAFALVLVVPAMWYALGPPGGLYSVMAKLPGMSSVRAPVHIWFVVALGIAVLAAEGLGAVASSVRSPVVLYACAALLFADLAYNNSFANPLAYARSSFDELYGNGLRTFTSQIGQAVGPLDRFHAPFITPSLGPQNHALDARVSVTYGYKPLALRTYSGFLRTAESNPKLLDELGARIRLDRQTRTLTRFDSVLPRVMFPKRVLAGTAPAALASLNTAEDAISPKAMPGQDASASATVAEHGEGFYRIKYKAKSESLLRVAETYFPGWDAESGGRALDVYSVDAALIGVTVPAGEGELRLSYHTPRLGPGLVVTLTGLLVAVGLMVWDRAAFSAGLYSGDSL